MYGDKGADPVSFLHAGGGGGEGDSAQLVLTNGDAFAKHAND